MFDTSSAQAAATELTTHTNRPRLPGRPWPKGTSGNASGKAKAAPDPGALARKHTVACIRALAHALTGSDPVAAVSAARALLELGYGLPSQHLALGMPSLLTAVVRGASDDEVEHSNGGARAWNA